MTKFGQTIGAVVADTKENAKIASKLVKITYEDVQPCVVTIEVGSVSKVTFNNEFVLI